MKSAKLWQAYGEDKIRCTLCAHECIIAEGKQGICGVRRNIDNHLLSTAYGRIVAEHIDPIEKKPLFHFHPASQAFSIGTVGCNFTCKQCQNADIAQFPQQNNGMIMGKMRTPGQVVNAAANAGCTSIAYTYNEPTVFFEFALDTAMLAHKKGLKNIFVSNGYLSKEAAKTIAPYLDAINIDLKAFNEKTYKRFFGGHLKPVLESISLMHALDVWVEVTTLVIPKLNDGPAELGAIADFILNISHLIPWHVSRFHPAHELTDRPVTPAATIDYARKIGLDKGLRYVYSGNLQSSNGQNTCCPDCGALLIKRFGMGVNQNYMQKGKCPDCKTTIPGVGM